MNISAALGPIRQQFGYILTGLPVRTVHNDAVHVEEMAVVGRFGWPVAPLTMLNAGSVEFVCRPTRMNANRWISEMISPQTISYLLTVIEIANCHDCRKCRRRIHPKWPCSRNILLQLVFQLLAAVWWSLVLKFSVVSVCVCVWCSCMNLSVHSRAYSMTLLFIKIQIVCVRRERGKHIKSDGRAAFSGKRKQSNAPRPLQARALASN